jgi:predicted ester cyclase
VDRADELVSQDYVDHGAIPGQAPGLEGAKRKWAEYIAAVPDLRTWSEDMVADGDEVAVRWVAEGTQKGELLGIPPGGKQFRFTVLSICRMAEGKMAEQMEGVGQAGPDAPARRSARASAGETVSSG